MIRRIITVLIAVLAFSPLTPVATAVNYGTPLGPPGAPRTVTAANADTSTSNVVVTWAYPTKDPATTTLDSGGDSITGYVAVALKFLVDTYTATAFSCSTPAPQPTTTSETYSCTISGLSYGTTYKFQVSASNSFGTTSAVSAGSVLTNSLTQTVSINPVEDRAKTVVYGAGDFRLYATSTGAPTITWASSPTGICTVDSLGVVHPVAVGTCYVNAIQDGVGTAYLPARDTTTVTVSPSLSATIQPATNVQGTSARLNAIVGFPGVDVNPTFCISETTFSSSCPSAPAGVTLPTPTPSSVTATSSTSVYGNVAGLVAGRTYYYNATVAYGGSTIFTNVETFTTITGMSLSYTGSLTGTVGTPMTGTLTASGGTGVYAAWIANSLPTGLVFTPGLTTATISGTPTATGRFSSVFLVTDSADLQKEDDEIFVISATSTSETSTAPSGGSSGNPIAQVISVTNVPSIASLASGPLVLNAVASSGLPLTYFSATPTVCTVSAAGVVIYVGFGTCTITINQSGNSLYLPATKTISFTIEFKLRVEIDEPTNVQSNSVTLNGNAPWPGYDANVKFCVSKTEISESCDIPSDLSLTDTNPSVITANSGGVFTSLLSGLVQNTNYYVWAIETSHGQTATSLVRKIHTPDGPTIVVTGLLRYKTNEQVSIEFKATGGAGGYKNWKITGLPTTLTKVAAASVLKVRGKSQTENRYFLKISVEDRKGASSTITTALVISNQQATNNSQSGGFSGTSQVIDPGFTKVTWLPDAGVKSYEVDVRGKNVCTTTATECVIEKLLGPKSTLTLIAHYDNGKSSLPDPVRVIPPASPVAIGVANFDLNKSKLTLKDKAEISQVAKIIEGEGFTTIQVSGHTDSTGSSSINGPLSQDRASVVFKYLQQILVGTPISVALLAKSASEPVASNATDSGRAANRRAVLSLR